MDGSSHRCGLSATAGRLRAIFRWIRLSQAALDPPVEDSGTSDAAAAVTKQQTRVNEGKLSLEAGRGGTAVAAGSSGGGGECDAALGFANGGVGGLFRILGGSSVNGSAGKLCGDLQSSPCTGRQQTTSSGESGSDGWASGRWIMTTSTSKNT